VRRRAGLALGLGLLAVALRILVGRGLVNYDTLYTLVWGRDLAHGHVPDVELALAPTPHPLATLIAALLSPLSSLQLDGIHGEAGASAAVGIAFLSLATLGVVVFRLGAAWFNPAAGLLAAVIVLTRQPVLDFGARAYVDIPYLTLVLGAVLAETRRRRAGGPVLLLLGLAGLLRPEAWLFAAAYWIYLWRSPGEAPRPRANLVRLAALAAAAPLLWALSDVLVTGNPLHSLTGTRATADTLRRVTGLHSVPGTVPRRLGEILREPVLLGAAGGGVMSLLWLGDRRHVRVGAAVGVASLVAFGVLAAAGLPILGRYLLLPATILALFCGAGAFGWMELPRDQGRRRQVWAAFAAVTALALLAFTPQQVRRIEDLRNALRIQESIQGDLADAVRGPERGGRECRPISVPNFRPVPLLALWLDEPVGTFVSLQERTPASGLYLAPSSPAVARQYVLDRRDLRQSVSPVPAGFRQSARFGAWRTYRTC